MCVNAYILLTQWKASGTSCSWVHYLACVWPVACGRQHQEGQSLDQIWPDMASCHYETSWTYPGLVERKNTNNAIATCTAVHEIFWLAQTTQQVIFSTHTCHLWCKCQETERGKHARQVCIGCAVVLGSITIRNNAKQLMKTICNSSAAISTVHAA